MNAVVSAQAVVPADDTRWNEFLGSIQSGMSVREAMSKHSLCRHEVESFVRLPARLRWPTGFPAIAR
jgi:hypothetical protein